MNRLVLIALLALSIGVGFSLVAANPSSAGGGQVAPPPPPSDGK